jgi:hypothetical protein
MRDRRHPAERRVITHVVLMAFADRADATEAKRRLEALPALIPDVRTLRADLDVLALSGSSDLCLTATYGSADALSAYAVHPAHEEFLAWVRPRLRGRAAVDYES